MRATARADELLGALLDVLWTVDRFAVRIVKTGELRVSDSLLDAIPIVLGEDLPASVHAALADRIASQLTGNGPATERRDSPQYAADGYWRGPIWALSTLLIEDGPRRSGHVELADEISQRFRTLCETSGFAENFDADTGAGLRDRAYPWTASVYLVLARAAARRDAYRLPPGTARFIAALPVPALMEGTISTSMPQTSWPQPTRRIWCGARTGRPPERSPRLLGDQPPRPERRQHRGAIRASTRELTGDSRIRDSTRQTPPARPGPRTGCRC